jgi:hypothetical protein
MSSFLKARLIAFGDNLIFWLFIGGGTLLISYLTAQSANAQGLPLYQIIFWVLLCLLLFALLANAFHVAWIRHAREQREAQDKWLHDLAKKHRDEIGRYVHVEECTADINPSSATPFIKFVVRYINMSVYTISIDPKFSGSISYATQRLKGPIEVSTRYPLDNLWHAYNTTLEFFQWLSQEERDFIMTDQSADYHHLDLSQLIFTIVGSKSEMGITPQPLRFGVHSKVKVRR